mmetsp:Transcript_35870/g.32266  ORF Transcript_35870/g.32266 Transcript_35870/m.32266 type:complete len:85 (-) Transcript_35870:392-646(-)
MKLVGDIEARAEWDKNIIEAKNVKKFDDTTEVMYMAIKMPLVMSNRDFLMIRQTINDKDHPKEIEESGLKHSECRQFLSYLGPV